MSRPNFDFPGFNDLEGFITLLSDTRAIFKEEPNYQELPLDRPIVFVGDTHGDIETTEQIFDMFFGTHLIAILGDYVTRAPVEHGSIKNIHYLFEVKRSHPEDLILLRGNHETPDHAGIIEIMLDLREFGVDAWRNTSSTLYGTFSDMPYVVSTENGLLGLHGGLPDIKSVRGLKLVPKGIEGFPNNGEGLPAHYQTALQILWNDHVATDEPLITLDGSKKEKGNSVYNYSRHTGRLYNQHHFNNVMSLLGKNVLVRGHDYNEKGYAFDDRLLTIFSASKFVNHGNLKGKYVAVMDDPQKELKTAKELRIVQL